ncbi:hypothetical protein ACFBZI_11395 [Moraxella sp. ZJ142]|uniref:hypothetical protein n=1 Tax=Moraxella marmotae TaxID=3344520 RepID=UPI0035D40B55
MTNHPLKQYASKIMAGESTPNDWTEIFQLCLSGDENGLTSQQAIDDLLTLLDFGEYYYLPIIDIAQVILQKGNAKQIIRFMQWQTQLLNKVHNSYQTHQRATAR